MPFYQIRSDLVEQTPRLFLRHFRSVGGMRRVLVIIGILGVISTALLSGAYIFVRASFKVKGPLLVSKTILISNGKSVSGIGHQLRREGVINNPDLFIWGFRLFGENKPLRAGEFAFEPGMSNAEVISHIQFGKTVVHITDKHSQSEERNNCVIGIEHGSILLLLLRRR